MVVDIDLSRVVDDSYQIHIGELPTIEIDKKVAIITNTTVSRLHLKTLVSKVKARDLVVVTIEDGEQYKNLKTIEFVLDELFKNRLDRKSMLIAFGGGVVGDMTGFVASIYQRGIEFIQIPTTLLSMTDASVGGKTGVNNSYGKNLVGSFYQPKAVYIDPDWIDTLPSREFSAGVAEIIKMAATLDGEFFAWLERANLYERSDLIKAIAKSVELKALIVAKDEKESGVRQFLNYGHTFAHVIEQETMYAKYLHGEAVAFGMVMANRLALDLHMISQKDFDRVNSLLERYKLDLYYEVNDSERFYEQFFMDKKSSYGKINFVLLSGIGDCRIVSDIAKDQVIKALNR